MSTTTTFRIEAEPNSGLWTARLTDDAGEVIGLGSGRTALDAASNAAIAAANREFRAAQSHHRPPVNRIHGPGF